MTNAGGGREKARAVRRHPIKVGHVMSGILAAALVSCGPQPFKELDPTGTAWEVVSVNDAPSDPDEPTIVEFGADSDVMIRTPCRTIEATRWIDTDTDGFAFLDLRIPTQACEGSSDSVAEQRLVNALSRTERWSVLADDRIEFAGTEIVALRLLQS